MSAFPKTDSIFFPWNSLLPVFNELLQRLICNEIRTGRSNVGNLFIFLFIIYSRSIILQYFTYKFAPLPALYKAVGWPQFLLISPLLLVIDLSPHISCCDRLSINVFNVCLPNLCISSMLPCTHPEHETSSLLALLCLHRRSTWKESNISKSLCPPSASVFPFEAQVIIHCSEVWQGMSSKKVFLVGLCFFVFGKLFF